jgi:HD superfamily phosphohydrolase
MNRRLLKLVFKEDIKAFKAEARQVLSNISQAKNRQLRNRVESKIAEIIREYAQYEDAYSSSDPSVFVIAHAYTFKNVKEQSRNDEASILIEDTPPKQFEAASTLFSSIDEKLSETSFEIYAPVQYSTPAERRSLKQKLRAPTIEALETLAIGGLDATV